MPVGVLDSVAVPVSVADGEGVAVGLPVDVGVNEGGTYCHVKPVVTGAPSSPLATMYMVRVLSGVIASVEASAFSSHELASGSSSESSFPRRHWNDSPLVGHPMPAYRTVLLAVLPHVLMSSVPPSRTPAPSSR